MSVSLLPNYLRANRKRLALSQDEVAFLLGRHGESKGAKVCRDERLVRQPGLETALAYEAIYQKPVRELFAGVYQQVEREVAARAKVLTYRKDGKPNRTTAHKRQVLARLASGTSMESFDPSRP
jgi:hypothetical protein